MPRKGHTPEQILNKLRHVDVAVANDKIIAVPLSLTAYTGQTRHPHPDSRSSFRWAPAFHRSVARRERLLARSQRRQEGVRGLRAARQGVLFGTHTRGRRDLAKRVEHGG